MLQEELDDALALLMETETARDTAQAGVTSLTGELTAATASVTSLTGELTAANASVTSLTGELATAKASVTSLTGELATAIASVTSLTGELATAKTSVTSLTGELATAKAEVTRLTNQVGSATDPTSLQGMLAAANAEVSRLTIELATANANVGSLTRELTAAKAESTRLSGLLDTALNRVTEAEEEAEEAQQTAQEQIAEQQQRVQGDEANQRAERFNTELRESDVVAGSSPVTLDLTTNGRLRLTRGSSYSAATLGDRPRTGSGMRVATLPLTGTGDTGKTVIYTDIELTRSLLEHYLPADATATRLLLAGTGIGFSFPSLSGGLIAETNANWKINHGVPPSLNATDRNNDNTVDDNDLPPTAKNAKRASSYSGSLHGVAGQFVCTGTSCRVEVKPDYGSITTDEKFLLADVTLDSTTPQGLDIPTGEVYFVPSARLPLYTGTGNPLGADAEYMIFGFWRQDPASPASPYQFHAFADAVGAGGTIPSGITAVYDGIAVGGYAEKDPGAAVVTWRQGEFRADVDLTATSSGVTGTIDDFVTTPTGGSTAPKTADNWLLDLAEGGTLTMPNLPGGTGAWLNELVPSRATTSPGNTAVAITGTFDANGPSTTEDGSTLTIVGAFGAELSSTR